MPNREEVLYQDFSGRLGTRLLWDSQSEGTAVRNKTKPGYKHAPVVRKGQNARKLTEAEDNAIARAVRRKQHRRERGWRPYAQR